MSAMFLDGRSCQLGYKKEISRLVKFSFVRKYTSMKLLHELGARDEGR